MGFLDIIFPKSCLGCSKPGLYICIDCINKLPKPVQTCPFCQKPSIDGVTHTKCRKKLGIDGIYSIFSYSGVVRKAILKLKFKYADDIVSDLVKYAVKRLKADRVLPKKAILTPIPLYWYKENVRGFNQSNLLGKQIAKEMGWDFNDDILIRKKLKKLQSVLKKEERVKNIRGVFSFNPNCQLFATSSKRRSSSGRNCIIFDDVYTTGSTLREAAKVLKRRGVRRVWGLTIAK